MKIYILQICREFLGGYNFAKVKVYSLNCRIGACLFTAIVAILTILNEMGKMS